MKELNQKGQVDVVGVIGSFLTLVIVLVIGLWVTGNLQESTVGDCVLGYTSASDSSVLGLNGTAGTNETSIALSGLITGSNAEDGNLTVTYSGGPVNATFNGHLLGETTSSPHTFSVDASYFSNPSNVSYTSSADPWNVTLTNITYYRLSSCDYTADAYIAMDTTYDMNFTAFSVLPIMVLIMAAVAVIGAVLVLRRV